ncbi:MAG: lumazine-binding protein [Actinomycetota bacterium]|nr:lumazine-binding protein [Actinomycetota bacterium]
MSDVRWIPEQLIGRVAAAQNDALQRADYQAFQTYTCRAEHATESEVLERQRNSSAEQGARFIDGVSDVAVDGDRATATVTYHFDRSEDDKFGSPDDLRPGGRRMEGVLDRFWLGVRDSRP